MANNLRQRYQEKKANLVNPSAPGQQPIPVPQDQTPQNDYSWIGDMNGMTRPRFAQPQVPGAMPGSIPGQEMAGMNQQTPAEALQQPQTLQQPQQPMQPPMPMQADGTKPVNDQFEWGKGVFDMADKARGYMDSRNQTIADEISTGQQTQHLSGNKLRETIGNTLKLKGLGPEDQTSEGDIKNTTNNILSRIRGQNPLASQDDYFVGLLQGKTFGGVDNWNLQSAQKRLSRFNQYQTMSTGDIGNRIINGDLLMGSQTWRDMVSNGMLPKLEQAQQIAQTQLKTRVGTKVMNGLNFDKNKSLESQRSQPLQTPDYIAKSTEQVIEDMPQNHREAFRQYITNNQQALQAKEKSDITSGKIATLNGQISNLEDDMRGMMFSGNATEGFVAALANEKSKPMIRQLENLTRQYNGEVSSYNSAMETAKMEYDAYKEDQNYQQEQEKFNYQKQIDQRNFNYGVQTDQRDFDYRSQTDERDYQMKLDEIQNDPKNNVEIEPGVFYNNRTKQITDMNQMATDYALKDDPVAQFWGDQKITNEGVKSQDKGRYTGMDFDTQMYDKIPAPAGGTITDITKDKNGNIRMKFTGDDGTVYNFDHLSEGTYARRNDFIGKPAPRGTSIAVAGNSGNVMDINGNKLRRGGKVIDQKALDAGKGSHVSVEIYNSNGDRITNPKKVKNLLRGGGSGGQGQKQQQNIPEKTRTNIEQTRDRFMNTQTYKNALIQSEALQYLNDYDVDNKGGADDISLIYSFAKAMDPDSVVREGEYATVQKYAQAWTDSLGIKVGNVLGGKAVLTPEARQEVINTMKNKIEANKKQYKAQESAYGKQIDSLLGKQGGYSDFIVSPYGDDSSQQGVTSESDDFDAIANKYGF